jgi:PPK2 family polyphosphate:nucleotide phosphotransferase
VATESKRFLVEPGAHVDLAAIDTASTEGAPGDKDETTKTFRELRHKLAELQERLYAESEQALLVVLQAMDGGGKDGTIKHVFRGVNPAGTRVASFKVPTEEELAHDFLWRVHKATPRKGEIVLFNRSHYEDVLVVRVHDLVPEDVWRPRYEQINAFEESLGASGTRIVKLFLHISKDEQADRFRRRLERPDKHWKFNRSDLDERALWDDYQRAYAEAIERTSTTTAPWYVVPADRKWYRNWAVSQIVLDALTEMAPAFPPAEDGLDDVVVT